MALGLRRFPTDDEIDLAQLVKVYGPATGHGDERGYNPAECTGCKKQTVYGRPDSKFISTGHLERQNLTMQMQMRRFTSLTKSLS